MTKEKSEKNKKSKMIKHGVTNYPVGDFLIRIKNSAMAKNRTVETANGKFVRSVAESLKDEGFLSSVNEKDGTLSVELSYRRKAPVLIDIEIVSRPGLRVYMNTAEIETKKGPFVFLVSTPKGVMSSRKALKERVGGEVIAKIY
jgi:small subunit ribosomal protein S8